jgi:HAD superfamily hydrolase (TIGR01509 family)
MGKVYFIDCDGTLVDSVNHIKDAVGGYLLKRNVVLTNEVWGVLIALGYENTAKYFIENYGDTQTVDEIVQELQQELVKKYATVIKIKNGVDKYLQKLYDEGNELYVVSGSPLIFVTPCLKNNDIYKYFKGVISVDDFKPLCKLDVEFYEAVASKLNANLNEVIYIEDSVNPIITGKKAGMTVYAVKDVQDEKDFEIIKSVADKVIYDFNKE